MKAEDFSIILMGIGIFWLMNLPAWANLLEDSQFKESELDRHLPLGGFSRDMRIHLYLDRNVYPSFQKLATGRVRLEGGNPDAGLKGTPALALTLIKNGKVIASQRMEPIESGVLDFDLPLSGLTPGTYELEAGVMVGDEALKASRREFVIRTETAPRSGRIPITIPAAPTDLPAWPITFGVPFPWGALDSAEHVQLLDTAGNEAPIQVKVTGRWSKKGSIRWLLIDSILPIRREAQQFTLVYGPNVRRGVIPRKLQVEQNDARIVIHTGPLRLVVPKRKTPGLAEVWLDKNHDRTFQSDERLFHADETFGPYLVDEEGVKYLGSADEEVEVVLEESGPLKTVVRVSGWHVDPSGNKLGKFILRYYCYAGSPHIRLFHTFIITADSNKVRYRDIGYAIPFQSEYYFFGTPKINFGWLKGEDANAYLIQLDDLHGKIYEDGVFADEFGKAEGWMSAGHSKAMMTLTVKDFWQQFPKELEVTPERVTVHFWPAHGEEPVRTGRSLSIQNVYQSWFVHEGKILDFKIPDEVLEYVKQDSERYNYPNAKVANAIGLAKTHEMLLYFHADDWERARARTVNRIFQFNSTATCDPGWVCRTKVFGEMEPRQPERFPRIEKALDETIANIFRQQEIDRDYGMFNFGDSHHNWHWEERRWNLHRIWRNTHHGWTRWPWLMYARTGSLAIFDWADGNARHVADIDHCHYATEEFIGLPWPRGKVVGGICDYKGFVHWASGGRLHYNSAADAMLHHYYFTGDKRSLTTALEHGAALIADGKAHIHREGSGRATSACALYFLTWDNDYLEFLERTIDRLLSSQREDGSFPQWEDFAPFLQRYVDLTRSRHGMKAMARWADSVVSEGGTLRGYGSKISILAHAYLYTGDEKYLRTAAYRVGEFVDNQYLGEDLRFRGLFIAFPSNLDQSYFMQWMPYYLAAVTRNGGEPEPDLPKRTRIRTLSREEVNGERMYVFHARLKQEDDAPFTLPLELSGYTEQNYIAELRAIDGGSPIRKTGATKDNSRITLEVEVPTDGQLEYALRVFSNKNFYVRIPITYGQSDIKEVYPIFREGTWVGDGFRYYFNLPEGAERFTIGYRGRLWPLKVELFDPSGECVVSDIWISSNAPRFPIRTLNTTVRKEWAGWSFSVTGYGQGCLRAFHVQPLKAVRPFYFSVSRQKLFMPRR